MPNLTPPISPSQPAYPWLFVPSGNAPSQPLKPGGSIMGAGVLQNTRLFDNTFGALNYPFLGINARVSSPLSQANSDENIGTIKVLAGGSFNNINWRQYVMIGYNQTIANISGTIINSPGQSYQRQGQAQAYPFINTRKINSTGGWWYTNGKPVNVQYSSDNIKTELLTNTYATPGRLTFMYGAELANVTGYKLRTN